MCKIFKNNYFEELEELDGLEEYWGKSGMSTYNQNLEVFIAIYLFWSTVLLLLPSLFDPLRR